MLQETRILLPVTVERPLLFEKPTKSVPLVQVYELVDHLVLPVHLVLLLLLLVEPVLVHHDILVALKLPVKVVVVPGIHHVMVQLLLNPERN